MCETAPVGSGETNLNDLVQHPNLGFDVAFDHLDAGNHVAFQKRFAQPVAIFFDLSGSDAAFRIYVPNEFHPVAYVPVDPHDFMVSNGGYDVFANL
ncbi:protein of unknown function [Azospirillum baldaniorum]|uniref:Uncharacterized protein n=1 Tax=Azospirillum baldaniorum TaxID=1064539 RepID=A0A9P1JQ37_9PROT|nr:protein of unknown function [Azospirillum baldaniorum]